MHQVSSIRHSTLAAQHAAVKYECREADPEAGPGGRRGHMHHRMHLSHAVRVWWSWRRLSPTALGRGSTVGGADGRAARCRRSRAGTSLGIRPLGRAEDGVDALEVLRLEDERAHLIYEQIRYDGWE